MIAIMLLIAVGWAGGLAVPVQRDASPGECLQATPLRAGGVLPPAMFSPEGTARCTAVIMPPFQVAYLLQLEEYHEATERLNALDLTLLETERDWYRDRLATELEPGPWYERPAAQRWLGRGEMIVLFAIVTAGAGYAYNAGR